MTPTLTFLQGVVVFTFDFLMWEGYVTLSWCLKLVDEISIGRLTLSARWCDLFLVVKEFVDG